VIERRGTMRSKLRPSFASALLIACLGCSAGANAQGPSKPPSPAAASGPAWSALTPAQQSALAPLRKDWPAIDAPRKQKWLEIAARFPSMPRQEQQRIQDRMNEWARMSPEERGRARLQFQEARQIDPRERQARWDAYLALPAEERRALSKSASTVPKASAAGIRDPADEATSPARPTATQSKNVVTAPSAPAAARTTAPAVVQARPGASTTLISKPASPPAHVQGGQAKIATGQGKVDRSTLLPQAAPQPAATPASAAQ
jgi:hypothetical protein